jgi:high-affinity Fe2+/Pb2+ permease
MSTPAAQPSKGRLWLNSFIMALASSLGYLIVALLGQHQTLVIVIAMSAIVVVLTPIFYWINVRRTRLAAAPRRDS